MVIAFLVLAWWSWRLGVAYRVYLQFKHSAAVVLSAQVIVLLAVVVLLVNVDCAIGTVIKAHLAHWFGAPRLMY